MINFEHKDRYGLEDLIRLVALLRGPGGCPWDQEQTHRSNRRNFLEEAYEAAEGFDRDDPAMMREELGDMLMQVLFNIRIEEELGRFSLEDVTDQVCKKLIFRHPHVFDTAQADNSQEVLVQWEERKRLEKNQQTAGDALDAVAQSLPALWRADKLQSKAERAGFAWQEKAQALDKLQEETEELRQAMEGQGDPAEELGDVLFAAVSAGRLAGLDPEEALNRSCEKFIRRFRRMEQTLLAQGRKMEQLSCEELVAFWQQAKGV